MGGPLPGWAVDACVALTLSTVMFSVGLTVPAGGLLWIWRRPGPMLRGVFSVLVAVPVIALAITRLLDLPRLAAIGIVLMAISPGAPVALRRSLGAGGHQAFAPSLEIIVVVLAVASMPLSIAALNHLYSGHASVAPEDVARQVFIGQLVPLGLGIAFRHHFDSAAASLESGLRKLGMGLLLLTLAILLAAQWRATADAGVAVLAAIVLTTAAALAIGHLTGGPEPSMRTAVAISSAARNAGLALLVATRNDAPPAVIATIMAYLLVSALTIWPYVIWRRRAGGRTPVAWPY